MIQLSHAPGEIVYRSPQTMAGYLHNPEAAAEAFRHGWFHSGDAGHFDNDGILCFEDRFKDVIKTGGENVSSVEVELAIRGDCLFLERTTREFGRIIPYRHQT